MTSRCTYWGIFMMNYSLSHLPAKNNVPAHVLAGGWWQLLWALKVPGTDSKAGRLM